MELFREQGPSRHCARRRCSRRDDQRRPRIPAIGTVLCGEFLVAFEIEVALLEDLLHDGDDAPAGFISGVLPFQWAQVVNIKRDRDARAPPGAASSRARTHRAQ
jgi:hypothetical protein